MTTNVKTVKRVLVSLNLPMKTASLVETATALVSPMTNPNFTAPHPPLASITAAVTALTTAQTGPRTHGAVANRGRLARGPADAPRGHQGVRRGAEDGPGGRRGKAATCSLTGRPRGT